jgi:hypothetical protein
MPARYPIMAVLVTALIAFLVIVAFRAWRARAAQQENIFSAPLEWLEHPSGGRQWTAIQYVATTVAGEPLNRVTAHGLGARGYGKITISVDGILIERNGERSIGIKAEQVSGATAANVTIDRAVENEGLIQISWSQDGFALNTFIRARNNDDRKQIFEQLGLITMKEQN